ncbi:MAG: hypothetical protein FWF82_04305 [Oscillospiraceae bacterium]|nr:hypothetical protein [Oscillospiraceae bacterium]
MQAYEGYLENGQFFPFGKQVITGRQRVTVTVLDDEQRELRRQAELKLFAELEKGRKSGEEQGWLSKEEARAIIENS